jgi:hypothetical protein
MTDDKDAAHTPGPWNVLFRTIVSNNEDIAEVNRLPGFENHASVRAETEANARLISAAPDLLAACRAALALITNPGPDQFDAYHVERILLAALEKAGVTL